MTLEEAKKFYFDYNGYSFHMDREEPLKYNAFCCLKLGKDVLKEWDEELLEEKFERMQTCPERAWTAHGDILKIMRRGNCDILRYADRLLEEMKQPDRLDAANKILIIENMAGRTASFNDGGVYFYCKYTRLRNKMHAVMEHLTASFGRPNGPDDWFDKDRLERAVRNYMAAYRKY